MTGPSVTTRDDDRRRRRRATRRDDDGRRRPRHATQPGRGRPAPARGSAALLVGVLGTLWVVQARSSAPTDFGADAGFARDMQTHHAQAVQLAFLVRDRTDDEEVRTVAFDIITSQQQQAGQMYGWLVQWGLDQTGGHAADGLGRGRARGGPRQRGRHHARDRPRRPRSPSWRPPPGVEAERIFLRLMIAHHTGGVAMAQAAADEARTPEVQEPGQGDRGRPGRRDRADAADARRRGPDAAQPASARRRVTRRASTS